MGNMQSGGAVDIEVNHSPSAGLFLNGIMLDVAHTDYVDVELDTIDAQYTDAIEDAANHKIVIGVAGFYLISAQIQYNQCVADKPYNLYVEKNDDDYIVHRHAHSSHAAHLDVHIARERYLDVGDYLKLVAQHKSGVGTIDIVNGNEATYLTIQRLR